MTAATATKPKGTDMAMIFDRFPSMIHAEGFAEHVAERFGLETEVFTDRDASDASDPFPFALDPPIVHVERAGEATERLLESIAKACGGVFAGT